MQDETGFTKDYSIRLEVQLIKHDFGIGDKDNSELTDDEIRKVVQIFGIRELDTQWGEDGKPIFGPKGVAATLCVVLYVFPWFYEKYSLSQFN
jgi:hypothetical protein